jgi:hypothetical protein
LDYDLAEDRDPNSQAFLERMEAEWQAEKIPYLRLLSRPMVSHHMVLSEHSHPVAFALATEDGNWGASLDTDGYMLGFCPKTGAKLWGERIYTTVYDGFTLNHDGSHPSYARGAHPSKMVISDGARPQVWTASFAIRRLMISIPIGNSSATSPAWIFVPVIRFTTKSSPEDSQKTAGMIPSRSSPLTCPPARTENG